MTTVSWCSDPVFIKIAGNIKFYPYVIIELMLSGAVYSLYLQQVLVGWEHYDNFSDARKYRIRET